MGDDYECAMEHRHKQTQRRRVRRAVSTHDPTSSQFCFQIHRFGGAQNGFVASESGTCGQPAICVDVPSKFLAKMILGAARTLKLVCDNPTSNTLIIPRTSQLHDRHRPNRCCRSIHEPESLTAFTAPQPRAISTGSGPLARHETSVANSKHQSGTTNIQMVDSGRPRRASVTIGRTEAHPIQHSGQEIERGIYMVNETPGESNMMSRSAPSDMRLTLINLDKDLALYEAAAGGGDEATIRQLVAEGADVDAIAADGTTALYAACFSCHVSAAKVLLELGSSINQASDMGFTPIDIACNQCRDYVAQWSGLTRDERTAVMTYGWEYFELPKPWIETIHIDFPFDFRKQVAATLISLLVNSGTDGALDVVLLTVQAMDCLKRGYQVT